MRPSVVLHENLHRNSTIKGDNELGKKLGTWDDQQNADGTYKDSGQINDTLEKEGCK
jgi:hypothetical protein